MKIFISILQALLALWTITGAVYMMQNYESLASAWANETLPSIFWMVFGATQIVAALFLLASIKERWRKYAAPAALTLAVIVCSGIVLYSAYEGVVGSLWAIIPAVLFVFVAYSREKVG